MQPFSHFFTEMQPTGQVESAVLRYLEWQNSRSRSTFHPTEDDDIDLRTYLTQLRSPGAEIVNVEEHAEAIHQFYSWAQRSGLIARNPFDEYTLIQAPLIETGSSLKPFHLPQDPEQSELESLRALDQITEELIRAVDIQSAMDTTLKTLLKVMDLPASWISIQTDAGLSFSQGEQPPAHGFVLAAAHGLPSGLEANDRYYLRRPPLCRCQQLLKDGRLKGAVNIIECGRLQSARLKDADTRSLRYHATAPLVVGDQPVGMINVASENWEVLSAAKLSFLTSVGKRLSTALERAQYYETAESRRKLLEKELKAARDIQQGLMSCDMPDIPGYQFACTWQPARYVAGDFYNIFPLSHGNWAIVIGDVADKGTAAALYMAMVQSLVISEALRHTSPARVLRDVSRQIYNQASGAVYVSVFLAVFNPETGEMQYANAGHNPPLLRSRDGRIQALNNTGSVVGVFDDLLLEESRTRLEHGDALVLYTDGLTETWRQQPVYEDYGEERLVSTLEHAPQEARGILQHLVADLEAFSSDEGQDDLTILVINRE